MRLSKNAPIWASARSRVIGLLLIFCAVALTIFYFYDLSIARAIYRPNTAFGAILDGLAPGFAPFIASFLFCTLAHTGKFRIAVIAEWIAAALCALITVYECNHYGELHLTWTQQLLFSAVLLGILVLLSVFCAPDSDELRRLTLCAAVMIVSVLLITEVMKGIWGRQRFCTMTDPARDFTDWLTIQGHPVSDAFKSFPSGHVANGSAVLLLLRFPRAFRSLRRFRSGLVCLVGATILLTAISRMVEGMHFASDVTAGFLIALLCYTLVSSDWFDRLAARLTRHW